LEAFPIPLTEAMACGTPIITSNSSGLAEIAGDAALFVDPGNPQEIAGGMERILRDPNLRSDLSRRALQRAKTFSWEKCATEILQVLQEQGQNGKKHAAG
jgi:glycosyltransferase involved in cell wall biosynthesis